MQEFHVANNIEEYVLTLMLIASNIFADVSIGNLVNVAVVDIIYLKEDLSIQSFHSGKYDSHLSVNIKSLPQLKKFFVEGDVLCLNRFFFSSQENMPITCFGILLITCKKIGS